MGARLRYIITPPTTMVVNPNNMVMRSPCFQRPDFCDRSELMLPPGIKAIGLEFAQK
jgi:hypothetical protein